MIAHPFDGSERRKVADVVPTASQATATGDVYGGLQESAVQDLFDASMRVVERQLVSLRRLQADADGRLNAATVEQQQLDRFLDEISYQVRFTSSLPNAASGQVAARLRDLQRQEAKLQERQAELRRLSARLQMLSSRVSWLVRQIELSAARLNESNPEEEDQDPWALVMRAQLIQGQEAERSRLARDIHDGPAQALTNTLMRLRLVEPLVTTQPETAARELALLRSSVQDSLADVRRSIFNLRPASLNEVGLVGTLERFITEYRKSTGLEIVASLPQRIDLGPEQELALFRIVQEALHNIVKHARANRIEISLARKPTQWELAIVDDGRGFDVTRQKQKQQIGSGLGSMRERAMIAGGDLELTSRPGYGTRLLVTLPVPDGPRQEHSRATEDN